MWAYQEQCPPIDVYYETLKLFCRIFSHNDFDDFSLARSTRIDRRCMYPKRLAVYVNEEINFADNSRFNNINIIL